MRLILARHGNTFEKGEVPLQIGARTNLPLTQYGINQAAMIAKYLKDQKIVPTAIFAGSLLRQTQSAEVVAKEFGQSYRYEKALNEIDYGPWEGLSAEEIESRWPQEFIDWNSQGKWAEGIFGRSFEEHKLSMEKWFLELKKSNDQNGCIVAFTSNGLLRSFRSEKVKTGHFCEMELLHDSLQIKKWNISPFLSKIH